MRHLRYQSLDFLKSSQVFIVSLFMTFGCSSIPKKLPIIQGATDQNTTQVGILLPKDQKVNLLLIEKQYLRLHIPVRIRTSSRKNSSWKVIQAAFKGLSSQKEYLLKVTETIDNEEKILDQRDLKTLPTQKSEVRFVLASCMDDSYAEDQIKMWRKVNSLKPDLILMAGDNVYADHTIGYKGPASSDTVWNRYVETRNLLEIFKFKKLIPILATWDDHDYGANDSNKNYPFKYDSLKTFSGFFPQKIISSSFRKGPGVSFVYKAFSHRFIFLDNRFFRSPKNDVDGTHWGTRQEKWLFSLLKEKPIPTYLIQGDQFFGAYHLFESLEREHPKSLERLQKAIQSSKSLVVFLSGDRHRTEITQIDKQYFGFQTYEITSSPIHAKTFPGGWEKFPNPRQIAGYEDGHSFVLIKSVASKKRIHLQVEAYNEKQEKVFERMLEVSR